MVQRIGNSGPSRPFAKGGIHDSRVSHPLPRTQRMGHPEFFCNAYRAQPCGLTESFVSCQKAAHAALVGASCRKSGHLALEMWDSAALTSGGLRSRQAYVPTNDMPCKASCDCSGLSFEGYWTRQRGFPIARAESVICSQLYADAYSNGYRVTEFALVGLISRRQQPIQLFRRTACR